MGNLVECFGLRGGSRFSIPLLLRHFDRPHRYPDDRGWLGSNIRVVILYVAQQALLLQRSSEHCKKIEWLQVVVAVDTLIPTLACTLLAAETRLQGLGGAPCRVLRPLPGIGAGAPCCPCTSLGCQQRGCLTKYQSTIYWCLDDTISNHFTSRQCSNDLGTAAPFM